MFCDSPWIWREHKPVADQFKKNLVTHRSSLYLVFACLVVLGITFIMTVGKDVRTRKRLEQQLSEASRQAEISEILSPLVTELQNNGEASVIGDTDEADLGPLLETDAENYHDVIEQMIRQCRLGTTTVTPDIQSILSDAGYIQVDLTTRGTFPNFRRLIIQLGRLPYLSGIDRYYVKRTSGAAELEMYLRLRINVPSQTGNVNGNE